MKFGCFEERESPEEARGSYVLTWTRRWLWRWRREGRAWNVFNKQITVGEMGLAGGRACACRPLPRYRTCRPWAGHEGSPPRRVGGPVLLLLLG